MRTKILILFPLCLLAAAAVWAAAAGDAADPLASLSYLNGVFASKVDAAVDARLENAGGAFADSGGTAAPIGTAVSWTESRLKRDDILQSVTGDGVLLVEEVQLPGKKHMDVQAFLRGNAVVPGTLLTAAEP